ncbi:MAG: hypothetical protein HGA96_15255 [Desulfobulbaceae bacterium]|nr:hypothetical protein [Desulfobulbaceae bacterium]
MERPGTTPPCTPRVLILYYSFSGQTTGLLHQLGLGLKNQGTEVTLEKIRPLDPPRFPVGAILPTLKMMVTTTLRQRLPIREPDPAVWAAYDLLILAGPTWSYNPSGPILDLIDRFGPRLFGNRQVVPLISCRGYWRLHWWGLRKLLLNCGALIPNRIIFAHPAPEPWRTIGVFMKIIGRAPERSRLLSRYYKRFGHSKEQLAEAERFGERLGAALAKRQPLAELDLRSRIPLS